MKKDKSNVLVYVVIFMVALGIGSVGMYYAIRYFKPLSQTVVNKLEKEVTVTDNGIADAVEKLYDAVVVVESYQNGTMVSSGSGFVYKTEGEKSYILTNNHVISGASEVKVKFTNNRTETVKVVGSDEYSDIGVLSIDKDRIIKVAEIGKAADTRLGDTAFVIGTPLASEYSWTVARGIISGKDRLVEVNASNSSVASWVMNVMQTDAAINSGNSGGPIANANGEVIGITNMKLVSSGVEGMGFAIPIEDAVSIAESLIKGGKIERPMLGVGTLDVSNTDALIREYGISLSKNITEGAVVGYVQKGSPADKAGLEKGDVITKFGDYDIKGSSFLKYYLYKYNVGDKVEITFVRGTKTETKTITLSQTAE